jgi:glutamate dehydrogenase (NAD(P)+)
MTLSYVNPTPDSPWGTYLSQVDRVIPYLGPLAGWASRSSGPSAR